MVVAVVALAFAIVGTAAATQVLVKHDKTTVVVERPRSPAATASKSKRGPAGPQGAQGPPGAVGAQGPQGGQGQIGPQGPSALKLDFGRTEFDNTLRTIGTQNELTVKATCTEDASNFARVTLTLNSSIPAVLNYVTAVDDSVANTTVVHNANLGLAAGTDASVITLTAPADGELQRANMFATYENFNRVITLNLFLIANDITSSCQVQGTAVPAS